MNDLIESSRKSWLVLFVSLAVVLLFGFLGARFFPSNMYTSVARIDVGLDPFLIQTQLHRIKSEALLMEVISELRGSPGFEEHTAITHETGDQDALRQVQRRIEVRQSRSATLIEIRSYASHPQVAADLANKLAEIYIRKSNTNGMQAHLVDRAVPDLR